MKKILYCLMVLLCLVACQPNVQHKVFGRYVPERKDDFAWENEFAAFRVYGPALAPENPSNGVDLWLKASPELIVDSFYYRELVQGLSYHINYGKGLDCYKVAHTAGCGGLVVVADSTLWVGGPYDRWQIIEQTPEKLVFRLEYDSLLVAGDIYRETLTVTAEAGQLLNRAEVVLECAQPSENRPQLLVGGGIYLHDSIDAYRMNPETGAVLYAEESLSDRQAAQWNYERNGSTSQGRSYIAVVTPGATCQTIMDGTLLSVRPYELGDTLTYWFGACWSEWKDGERAFPTDEDWFNAFQ